MRNRYPGICYRCHQPVAVGAGHFERFQGSWRTQHAGCAIECRGKPDPVRETATLSRLQIQAAQTGRPAQRARKRLRDMSVSTGQ